MREEEKKKKKKQLLLVVEEYYYRGAEEDGLIGLIIIKKLFSSSYISYTKWICCDVRILILYRRGRKLLSIIADMISSSTDRFEQREAPISNYDDHWPLFICEL